MAATVRCDDHFAEDQAPTRSVALISSDGRSWTHHDLDEVDGRFGTLVQFDAEVASESVDRQAAAVDRLQQQYLTRERLRLARRRAAQQQERQRRTLESDKNPRHLRS